jgi:hypothetical protein
VSRLKDDPLATRILAEFAALADTDTIPVGPRGIGYLLLGTQIDGRLVIKDKDDLDEATFGAKSTPQRGEALGSFIDFDEIGDTIVALRRSHENGEPVLQHEWVADGRTEWVRPLVADNVDQVRETLRNVAATFGPNFLADQDVFVEGWCEAVELAKLIGKYFTPYGIAVYSGSGDVPLPAIQAAAQRYTAALEDGEGVVVLIIGDHDLDGVGNADRLLADIEAHLPKQWQGIVTWRWIAPLAEHLARWRATLQPAAGPPKLVIDRKGIVTRDLPFTMQADALLRKPADANPDNLLKRIMDEVLIGREADPENDLEAIVRILDMETFKATRDHWDTVEQPKLDAAMAPDVEDEDESDEDVEEHGDGGVDA